MRLQLCPLCHHRYLQMADKVQRTLAMLTERLDRHRGAGQQSITVKHVTVNCRCEEDIAAAPPADK
jgi:hypothetical protein